jgi:ferric-dicitrate binding protein FerR (iron transport regulator)
MPVSPTRFHYLLQQYAADNCSKKDLLELFQAIDEAKNDQALEESLQIIWQNLADSDTLPVIDKEQIFSNIINATAAAPVLSARRRLWPRFAAAAAIFILVLGAGAYLYITNRPQQKIAQVHNNFNFNTASIADKPILTLADGTIIMLDSVHNGALTQDGNTTIIKLNNGELLYKTGPAIDKPETVVTYNTLTTPKGKQYQITLPDGSKVWLNAASSLHFPTAFNGKERDVALTGEAYFEIQKNKDKPFHVQVNDMKVEVLGTHFNVKAYDEEDAIKTTLLEGAVRIAKTGGLQATLAPGQQAQLKKDGNLKVMKNINTEEAIAWKRGELILNNVNMTEAAQIISRWYNVSFVFQNPRLKKCRFSISFLKGETIEQAMELISMYNEFDYHIENRTITLTGKGCQ